MKNAPAICRIIIAASMLLATAASHAQGNIVNLYNWTPDTNLVTDSFITVDASNSAHFYAGGAFVSTNTYNESILNGNLATVPGLSYEIAFTIQNTGMSQVQAWMSFGNFTTNLTAEINAQPIQVFDGFANTMEYAPINIDFILVATSLSTLGDFDIKQDNSGRYVDLSNFSVTVVPEPSTAGLIIFGGGSGLLAFYRRSFFGRKYD